MNTLLLDNCSYLLKDGRYIRIQSCSNEDCYVYFFIENKEIVNDGIIQNVVLQRIPELILDCSRCTSIWKTLKSTISNT